eukprot:TRINITY_DN73288_c0_g1_i3.p1 TRINITY_DN73288_c0_g1~~TRINITY_DN73288_c0_g1_i3.p1  ORF type:complete len:386 (-),score=62.29 TRINITY_DN73288_c0_g1_i3:517-1674(-)
MDFTFLGTGSGRPTKTRNVSCFTFKDMKGNSFLVDCGEGTQHQMFRNRTKVVKADRKTHILITHLHGDHIFGLPGMLCSMSMGMTDGQVIDLTFVGPEGLTKYLVNALAISDSKLECFRIHCLELRINEISEKKQMKLVGKVKSSFHSESEFTCINPLDEKSHNGMRYWQLPVQLSDYNCKIVELKHHPHLQCLGFILEQDSSKLVGNINKGYVIPMFNKNRPAYLEQGIRNPMKFISDLKKGEVIELPDGTILSPDDHNVITPPPSPLKIAILGDCFDASSAFELMKGCDLLIHECTNAFTGLKGEEFISALGLTVSHGHSLAIMAGLVAKIVGAKKLICSHFGNRFLYKPDDEESIDLMSRVMHRVKLGSSIPTVEQASDLYK